MSKAQNYINQYGILKGVCILFYKLIHKFFLKVYEFYVEKNYPVSENIIMFQSLPDYSDNSQALSEYMERNGYTHKYQIYWLVDDPKKEQSLHTDSQVHFISEFANSYHERKFSTIRIAKQTKYFMGTHGLHTLGIKLRPGQKRILLWHGCSFKEKTIRDNKAKFDQVCVAGPLFIGTKSHFWNITPDRIIAKGYPRYSWLQEQTPAALSLRREILHGNEKLVIWMPTFRNDKKNRFVRNDEITQFPLMHCQQSWDILNECCNQNKVMLLVKLHDFQKEYDIDFSTYSNIKRVSNVTFIERNIPMYNFLAVTDALISDYSSVAVDYLVVNKPIAYTLDDYEAYKSVRGFVFDDILPYMPGHHIYNIQDLEQFISDIAEGKDKYRDQRNKMSEIEIAKSDDYCKDVLDAIGICLLMQKEENINY